MAAPRRGADGRWAARGAGTAEGADAAAAPPAAAAVAVATAAAAACCPRCRESFACNAGAWREGGAAPPCWCRGLVLDAAACDALARGRWRGCLCAACLQALGSWQAPAANGR